MKARHRPLLSGDLQDAIRQSSLTYYELAKLSGVDASIISRFMSHKQSITLITADRLVRVLGYSLQEVK